MHRTPRTALVVAAVASVLCGSGCTTLVPGLPAPTGATTDPAAAAAPVGTDGVAWVGKICGATLPVLQVLSSQQPSISGANSATASAGLSGYLDKVNASADESIKSIAAAGPSPIDGGDKVAATVTQALTSMRDTAKAAKTKVAAIDTSDRQAIASQLPALIAPLAASVKLPDLNAELESNPALEQAAAQAPECQQVRTAAN